MDSSRPVVPIASLGLREDHPGIRREPLLGSEGKLLVGLAPRTVDTVKTTRAVSFFVSAVLKPPAKGNTPAREFKVETLFFPYP